VLAGQLEHAGVWSDAWGERHEEKHAFTKTTSSLACVSCSATGAVSPGDNRASVTMALMVPSKPELILSARPF